MKFLDGSAEYPLSEAPFTSAGWLVPVVYTICGLAFVFDLLRTNDLAYGVLYIPFIATAVFHKSRHALWILVAIACAMVVIGAFFPFIDPDLPDMIGNRILSVLAIFATAVFVQHARNTQERLAAERRRAEAAERIKTEVFTNLSEEMRTPLHALLGVMNLMMPGARPDQVEALERVRTGGRQLLETIDNLIELTRIDELDLRRQPVDVTTLAREAAADARSAATEHEVAIEVSPSVEEDAVVVGDARAIRRILDNLIAYIIQLSTPGAVVSVAVKRNERVIVASITDGPPEMPWGPPLKTADAVLPENGRAALTLSQRLARAMNGQLTVSGSEGFGATVSLSLPAA